ncbi:helix-turn-helix transcriptional regulator [Nocardia sp. NPDC059764]|uniref:helix-turn-helix transcriptional regulator n=1 Tax=Nocardia sp. NPDC059764 TaxID=3346939 RepID=UPI0036472A73
MSTRLDLPTIPPSVLSGLVEIGAREARDVGRWFTGTGLTAPDVLTADSIKVSFRQAVTVLRRAIADMPGRPLGMQVGGRREPDVMLIVETLLEQNLRHPLTMAEVAARLHVTERTLRRQLATAGESFSSVRDRVRERRATYLLQDSGLPISAIAHQIGYSDIREFRRAYIRWTGSAPSVARRPLG